MEGAEEIIHVQGRPLSAQRVPQRLLAPHVQPQTHTYILQRALILVLSGDFGPGGVFYCRRSILPFSSGVGVFSRPKGVFYRPKGVFCRVASWRGLFWSTRAANSEQARWAGRFLIPVTQKEVRQNLRKDLPGTTSPPVPLQHFAVPNGCQRASLQSSQA